MLSILTGTMFPKSRFVHRALLPSRATSPTRREMTDDDSDPETGFLEQLGQRVRTMRAPARHVAQGARARCPAFRSATSRSSKAARATSRSCCCAGSRTRWARTWKTSSPTPTPAPDWPVIRDLLRKASPAQIAQAKDALAGGSAVGRTTASCASLSWHRADRPARRRQVHARPDGWRSSIGWSFVELNKEIESAERIVGCRDHRALRPGRLSPHGAGGADAIAGSARS